MKPFMPILMLTIFSSSVFAYGAPEIPKNHPQAIQPITPVHLCNWHEQNENRNSWEHASVLPLRNDRTPIPGYDSYDENVIREQNAEMAAAGLTPMISWWGPESSSGDQWLDWYLSMPGPPVMLLYEVTGRLKQGKDGWYDMDDPENAQIFLDDIAHLNLRYWANPKYADRWARVDHRPVLFIWLSHAFRGNFRAVSTESRKRASYYLIGSDFNLFEHIRGDAEEVIVGMDAVSAYGVYSPLATVQNSGVIAESFVQQYERNADLWLTWLAEHAPGTKLLLPFSFAFDDTKVPGRANPPLTIDPAQAPQWAARVRAFQEKALAECRPILPGTNIISWNEAFEGTSIEPSDRWGDLWLRIVRDTLTPTIIWKSSCQ